MSVPALLALMLAVSGARAADGLDPATAAPVASDAEVRLLKASLAQLTTESDRLRR